MSLRQEFLNRFLNPDASVQVYPATVKSVEGATCTVVLMSSGLEIEGVRLVADVDAEKTWHLVPKVDSLVLIAAIENEISNAFVCQFSEVSGGNIQIDSTAITFDKDAVTLKNHQATVQVNQDKATLVHTGTVLELSGKKVSIKNEATSLKELFDDLTNLIQNLKVLTPSGPSTALSPDSLTSLVALKAKVPQLLS